jgi:hypothetical protein
VASGWAGEEDDGSPKLLRVASSRKMMLCADCDAPYCYLRWNKGVFHVTRE